MKKYTREMNLNVKNCGKIILQSLAPIQYHVMHPIMIFKFFDKIKGFVVLFEEFSKEDGHLYNITIEKSIISSTRTLQIMIVPSKSKILIELY